MSTISLQSYSQKLNNSTVNNIMSMNQARCNQLTSNYIEDDESDSEDLMVDLNTGSLKPVSLKSYSLMTEITEKFGKL